MRTARVDMLKGPIILIQHVGWAVTNRAMLPPNTIDEVEKVVKKCQLNFYCNIKRKLLFVCSNLLT